MDGCIMYHDLQGTVKVGEGPPFRCAWYYMMESCYSYCNYSCNLDNTYMYMNMKVFNFKLPNVAVITLHVPSYIIYYIDSTKLMILEAM